MGVSLLDPVAIERPVWTYEGFATGPGAGARAGCAAVATAANGRVRSGETIFVISNQRVFGWRGLATMMPGLGRVASLTIVEDGQAGTDPVATTNRLAQRQNALNRTARADSIRVLTPRVRYARSLVESIHADDAAALLAAVAAAGAVSLDGSAWAAPPLDSARATAPRGGTLGEIERQWMALVDLPGKDIEVVSVHPLPPVVTDGPEAWQREMAGLPTPDSTGAIRVLAGDFNATLDHVGITRLLNKGYVDAADQVGKGLIHTWPSNSGLWPPPVTIDHVLVDTRCPVDELDVFDVPGSDHRAVVTQFVVPRL